MAIEKKDTSISARIARDEKAAVMEAAAALGQTVSEFTVSTVVRQARQVLQNTELTRLSNRDRDTFLAAIDTADAKPNNALKAAARRYKNRTA